MKNKDIDVSKIVNFFNETMSYGPISFNINLGPTSPFDPDDPEDVDSPEVACADENGDLGAIVKVTVKSGDDLGRLLQTDYAPLHNGKQMFDFLVAKTDAYWAENGQAVKISPKTAKQFHDALEHVITNYYEDDGDFYDATNYDTYTINDNFLHHLRDMTKLIETQGDWKEYAEYTGIYPEP